MNRLESSEQKSSHARTWLLIIIALSLLGLLASMYLSYVHWSVHNLPGHSSGCAINQKINCDTVALSRYSTVLAGISNSVWTGLYYIMLIALCVLGLLEKKSHWPLGLIGILNLFSVFVSVILLLISELIIQSFCIYCVCLSLINVLTGLVWILGPRPDGVSKSSAAGFWMLGPQLGFTIFSVGFSTTAFEARVLWLVWLLLTGVWIFLLRKGSPRTWTGFPIRAWQDVRTLLERPKKAAVFSLLFFCLALAVLLFAPKTVFDDSQFIAEGVQDIHFGKTEDGHNWIGALEPEITITEYSDYQCPFCRMAHEVVRQLVREQKDQLRIVHVHVPLDHNCNPMITKPFHPNACNCARAAVCADEQGRFWQMNDALFVRQCNLDANGLAMLAQNLGMQLELFRYCMQSISAEQKVRDDIRKCQKVAKECVKMGKGFATPMFQVAGEVIIGYKNKAFWDEKITSIRKNQSDPRKSKLPHSSAGLKP